MSPSRNHPKAPREMNPPDGPSPTARAAQWASRIMTISLEMVLPGLAGYWLDTKLGTRFVFMLLGFAIGCTAAFKHLLYLTQRTNRSRTNQPFVTKKKDHDL